MGGRAKVCGGVGQGCVGGRARVCGGGRAGVWLQAATLLKTFHSTSGHTVKDFSLQFNESTPHKRQTNLINNIFIKLNINEIDHDRY